MNLNSDLSCSMVIFGATGDLAHRKLLPAIYNLQSEELLPENFAVVAIGRRDKTKEDYRKEIYDSIKQFSRFGMDNEVWSRIKNRIYYRRMDFLQTEDYQGLNEYLNEIDKKHKTKGNRIYYMAVAPEYFEGIVENLNSFCIDGKAHRWNRVVIEKPFGKNLSSAIYLNNKIVIQITMKYNK